MKSSMKGIINTCIGSEALRKDSVHDQKIVKELTELIHDVRVQLIGPIRQKILSGIKSLKQFNELKEYFSAFLDLPLDATDYKKAAEFYNLCKRKGIEGSNTDFLVCAVASQRNFEIYSIDNDFNNFQKYIPIKLHKIQSI